MTNSTPTRTALPTRPLTRSEAEGVAAYEGKISTLGEFKASLDLIAILLNDPK